MRILPGAFLVALTAVAMPLTPAMRPLAAISMTAAAPISAPPRSEATGVKSVAAMSGPRPRAGADAEQHIGRADAEGGSGQ